jgi:hypothetical protein
LLSGLCGVLFKALLYQIRLPVFVIVILCLAYMCLWSPSRGKNAGPVKSLVVRSMNGSTGLFAFLEDGTLRVWDLLNRHRLLNCSLSSLLELEGYEVRLMWVEEGGTLAVVQVALLCDSSSVWLLET